MTKTLSLHESNSTFTSKAQTSRESASSFQNLQTSDSVLALFPLSSEFYLLNPLYAQFKPVRLTPKSDGKAEAGLKKKVMPVPLRTDKSGPNEDTSSGPHHVWPTASLLPPLTFPGPASSRVRARARSREGGLTWRGNVQQCSAWRSDQGQVYPGVPHRDSLS